MSSGEKNDPDTTVVLIYYDSLLRNEDVDTLRGSQWLNDAVIGFYFEYLQHTSDDDGKMLFVSPELTQLLKMSDASEYPESLDPLNAKQRDYLFFPLNDCDSRNAAGGSHWSLLVYSKAERTTFHLDSNAGTNLSIAAAFAKQIMKYLLESSPRNFEEKPCPQQDNGYDCGLFPMCLTDSIIGQVQGGSAVKDCTFQDVLSAVSTKRKDLLRLIDKIIAENGHQVPPPEK